MALLPNVISVWEFDADFTDEVGSNDGTAHNGAARDTGTKLLGAASLAVDGANDYVKCGVTGIPDADEPQSWACWARYTSTPTGNQNLMSAGTIGSSCQFGFREWWDPEDPEQMEPLEIACAWQYGGGLLVSDTTIPSINTWHHYCYTFDGTTHRFYVDGSLVDSSTESAQTGTPVGIGIGAWQAGAEYFGGHIDQAAVWGRALSADDVAALYNSGSGVAYADWDVSTTVHRITVRDSLAAVGDVTHLRHRMTILDPLAAAGDVTQLHKHADADIRLTDAAAVSDRVTLRHRMTLAEQIAANGAVTHLKHKMPLPESVKPKEMCRSTSPCWGGYFERRSGDCAATYNEDDDQDSNLYRELVDE